MKKAKKLPLLTISDCKRIYEEKGKYRYAVVSVRSNMPICLCPTYESAKDDVKDYWLYNSQLCKIIDLAYYNPYN